MSIINGSSINPHYIEFTNSRDLFEYEWICQGQKLPIPLEKEWGFKKASRSRPPMQIKK